MPDLVDLDPSCPTLDKPDAFNFEANRKKTFEISSAYFSTCHIKPDDFAKQGFFATGNCDEVECFRCRGKHSNWQANQDLYHTHRSSAPTCPAFTDDDAAHEGVLPNIPIPLRHHGVRIVSDILNGFWRSRTPFRLGIQESGQGHNDISVYFRVTLRPSPRVNLVPRERDGSPSFTARYIEEPQPVHLFSEFASAEKREHTYRHFPLKQPRLTMALIRHGFFFVGHDDIVLCYSCGLALSRWQAGDDPRLAHVRLTGEKCPHLCSVESPAFIERSLRDVETIGQAQ